MKALQGSDARAAATKSIGVLVADDESVIRDALSDLLSSEESFEVVAVARDADEAIQLAASHRPDIALLDVRMPGGGGPRAAREIRRLSPRTRIVALSAYGDRAAVRQMVASGAASYIVKGTSAQEILATIGRTLRGHTSLSSEVATEVVHELADQLERQEQESERWSQKVDRIRRALNPGSFALAFQPIADIKNGQVIGVEALTRFVLEPKRGPDAWFAEADEVGLLIDLEVAAMEAALANLQRVQPGAFLSVNLSPATVLSPTLLNVLESVSQERVVIEITEHARVEDYAVLDSSLGAMRERGVRLAIDDAGAGYASLQHILRLAPDIIKLDISLTRDVDSDPRRRALASALIVFAAEIGAGIVAEGIETAAQVEALCSLGVSFGQGYYLARPGPLPPSDANP